MICRTLKHLLLFCVLPCAVVAADPATVEDLQSAGRLQVKSSLHPEQLIPGQKGALILEIATDTWFTGGTRIRIPEIPGLVLLQTEQFASNASENRKGQSWVIQRWTLDIYPQREGAFSIPPLELTVEVNGGAAGSLQGEIQSPGIGFTVNTPFALEQEEFWVASPRFELQQHFDRDLEGLQVGDAFEREVRFEADDVLPMMLPTFSETPQQGLAAYPAPAQLNNAVNRGQARATRIEKISYVVETEGSFVLPAHDFSWWDTGTGKLQLLSLPATEIIVGSGVAPAPEDKDFDLSYLAYLLALIVLGTFLWWLRRQFAGSPLQSLWTPVKAGWKWLGDLRKPALPTRLNPDGSAGD